MDLVIDTDSVEIETFGSRVRVTLKGIDESDLDNHDVYDAIDQEKYLERVGGMSEDDAGKLQSQIDALEKENQELSNDLSNFQ